MAFCDAVRKVYSLTPSHNKRRKNLRFSRLYKSLATGTCGVG